MKTWRVILVLSAAQFILVLDTTVMNVSISNVVADLNTTVEKVQLAITAYMLVMASTMLLGGKLGDIWGRRRAFRIGLVVFAVGSGLTSIAPDVGWLLFGWSLVEGLGRRRAGAGARRLDRLQLRRGETGGRLRDHRWGRRGGRRAPGR